MYFLEALSQVEELVAATALSPILLCYYPCFILAAKLNRTAESVYDDMATTTNPNSETAHHETTNSHRDVTKHMSHEEHEAAKAAARFGYGPLAHAGASGGARHAAFGGEFQPGTFASVAQRKFANPAPMGLSAFALTTFVLSLINVSTRDIGEPNIVVASAFGYGGLVQLLAGMW